MSVLLTFLLVIIIEGNILQDVLQEVWELLELRMFGYSLFDSLLACGNKKSFWSIHIYNEIYGKCLGVCENFSFLDVRYEYVMLARLKEQYRVNTIVSSIFFVGGTQSPILDTTYHERSS